MRVAFSLAFATHAALPEAAFFVCQQHEPDNFWNPDFQEHANGAADVIGVTCAAPEPGVLKDFLADFTGVPVPDVVDQGFSIELHNSGRIHVTRAAGRRGFTSFAVSVPDLDRMSRILMDAGLKFRTPVANRIAVGPEETYGVVVEFVSQEAEP